MQKGKMRSIYIYIFISMISMIPSMMMNLFDLSGQLETLVMNPSSKTTSDQSPRIKNSVRKLA